MLNLLSPKRIDDYKGNPEEISYMLDLLKLSHKSFL
jgi:hypothetical protein